MSGTLRVSVLLAVFLGLAAAAVHAQEQRGRIIGVVTDNTDAVLPGVTVTATSPALIQPQIMITDADGSYRFPALPTGVYNLTFELAGFQTLRRERIQVALNTTVTIDVQISLSGVQETVTIVGESPMVDSKSTGVATSFQEELLRDVPNARDIWSTMAQAPGFQMAGYDVGGSHMGTQTAYITYGFQGQNTTRIEGVNVTEDTSGTNLYLDFGSIDEYQVGGSGNMGDQAGPGALLSIMIKSGGDEFHGMGYADFENSSTIVDNVPNAFRTAGGTDSDGFVAPKIVDPVTGRMEGLKSGNPITKQFDLNGGLGGPILKRKAWFYFGARDNEQFKTILGVPVEAETTLRNWTVKGTYQLNTNNQLIAFYTRRLKIQPERSLSLTTPLESAQYQKGESNPGKLEWTSIVSPKVFLDLQVSRWLSTFPLYPTQTQSSSVEGVPVGRIELTTNQLSGANSNYQNRVIKKPQFSGNVSVHQEGWAGTHDIKVGLEWYRDRGSFLRIQPGDIYYRDRNGVPVEVDIYNTPNEAINHSDLVDVYIRDSWMLNQRLTLNLGARWERYNLGWPEQGYTPNQRAFFQPKTVPATHIVTFNSLSPRVGFALDLTGRGRTVWKGFYGRFYFNPSWSLAGDENPVGQAALRYRFNDLNGNRILDEPHELGAFISSSGGGGRARLDRDIEHAYVDEVSTHFEHELAANFAFRGTYVFKGQRKGWGEVDVNRAPVTNIPVTTIDPLTQTPLTLLDRLPNIPEDRVVTNPARYGLPDSAGDYHTVEFALNRRFQDRWMMMTSLQHTWSDDWRSPSATTNALNAVRQSTSYSWNPNLRRTGREKTTYWNYKLVGRYVLPWDIGASASYKLQSGYHWGRALNVSLPVSGTLTILAEPVNSNRAPNVHILDFRLDKTLKVLGTRSMTGMIDIFNVLNANPVANFRVITGSRFKEVISLLDPRIVRFGVRFDF